MTRTREIPFPHRWPFPEPLSQWLTWTRRRAALGATGLRTTRMTRKIEGERRRAGERKEEFDSRIKGLKLRVIVTARFLSPIPLDFFFGNFSFFGMDWLDTFWEPKKRPIFFSFFQDVKL